MNCFQTRKEFANFWRERLAPPAADEIANHLECCGLCEHAYRLFALTAPVLHSEPDAVDAMLGKESPSRPGRRRAAVDRSGAVGERGMVWTALTMLVAASVVAYIAVTAPSESLTDALSKAGPSSTISAVQEPPSSFLDDFAG